MPKLRCSATTCGYNQEECCCRDEIYVAGHDASTANETCCNNFYEAEGNARDVVSQRPDEIIEIACEAQHCMYNQNCKCHADYVDVNGYGVSNAEDTACASFCVEN